MHWPQVIYLATVFFALGISIAEHGKPKEGKNNSLGFFIGLLIQLSLLYWGGFFDCFLSK